MLQVSELTIHDSSFTYYGDAVKELNVENEFHFIDFLDEEKLTDLQYNILSSFSFNTVVTKNYHYHFINSMKLELNQLNYAVTYYDINNFEKLREHLLECIEFQDLEENEIEDLMNLFEEAIDEFQRQLFVAEEEFKQMYQEKMEFEKIA